MGFGFTVCRRRVYGRSFLTRDSHATVEQELRWTLWTDLPNPEASHGQDRLQQTLTIPQSMNLPSLKPEASRTLGYTKRALSASQSSRTEFRSLTSSESMLGKGENTVGWETYLLSGPSAPSVARIRMNTV